MKQTEDKTKGKVRPATPYECWCTDCNKCAYLDAAHGVCTVDGEYSIDWE